VFLLYRKVCNYGNAPFPLFFYLFFTARAEFLGLAQKFYEFPKFPAFTVLIIRLNNLFPLALQMLMSL
jgi:hypothetical protein